MLCFSRDTELNHVIQTEMAVNSKSKQHDGPGIVPYHGICMFGNRKMI